MDLENEVRKLQAAMDSQMKDFEARSRDYHDTIVHMCFQRTALQQLVNRYKRALEMVVAYPDGKQIARNALSKDTLDA